MSRRPPGPETADVRGAIGGLIGAAVIYKLSGGEFFSSAEQDFSAWQVAAMCGSTAIGPFAESVVSGVRQRLPHRTPVQAPALKTQA